MDYHLTYTERQRAFILSTADEVLYGGAAGGGKSHGQVLDAFIYAMRYPKSKQILLRRTFPELDKSIIRTTLEIYPQEVYRYNDGKHTGKFRNGSIIDFGYCDSENDVYRYQSAEFDVIRFDELTHFTEEMYLYLMSRLRGPNDFPKQIKSSTNPGGIGHHWVKKRFLDPGIPDEPFMGDNGQTRVFLPAKLDDNPFLMEKDPNYRKRLLGLPEKERRALLYGDWDIFEGQFFTEWNRDLHIIKPFPIPADWRRYFVMDYGLDMLAGYWIAVDGAGRAYVYKEIWEPGLIISRAAERIREMTNEDIFAYIAPPDMWNRRQDTGKSVAEIFGEHGIPLTKSANDRVSGWRNMREWLRSTTDEQGRPTAGIRFFYTCGHICETIPELLCDKRNPEDAATEPHECTHGADAIRYFCGFRPVPAMSAEEPDEEHPEYEDQIDNFLGFGGS